MAKKADPGALVRNSHFGNFLRQCRESRGVKQRALARDLGITAAYLSDIEQGKRAPFLFNRLEVVSRLLQVPLDDLRWAALGGASCIVCGTAEQANVYERLHVKVGAEPLLRDVRRPVRALALELVRSTTYPPTDEVIALIERAIVQGEHRGMEAALDLASELAVDVLHDEFSSKLAVANAVTERVEKALGLEPGERPWSRRS